MENIHFSNENSKELFEQSRSDPELTKALLRECMEAEKYDAAMIFADQLAGLMPDSYEPVHAKCAVLLRKKQLGEVGLCIAAAQDRFGDDPNYINDRLAYTIDVMGTEAAQKYLDKIAKKPAYESRQFLDLCARVYYDTDESKYIKCLFILHKQFQSEHARFMLALKSIEHQKYEAALKWYVAVINGYSGSAEYYMSLAGRCSLLQLLQRENWQEEMRKAAVEIDLASSTHIDSLWLRTLSEQLWEILGNKKAAQYNHEIVEELKKYAENPEKYIKNLQAVNSGETRE